MKVKRIAVGVLTVAVFLSGLLYAGDYVVLRFRIGRGSGYGTVTVRQYYAIGEKNNRTEYVYGSTQDQPCVNSLFGHRGLLPCWYLRSHPDQQVQI